MLPKKGIFILFLLAILPLVAFAQLNIKVHVWGEVVSPGDYLVPEGTDVLQLISKAGGPTEYANLGGIRLTHRACDSDRVINVNINDYLENEDSQQLPVLKAGDVVRVPRNTWYMWRTLIQVAADVAIIANVYYWFTRER